MGNQKEVMQNNLRVELRAYFREYTSIQNAVDLHDELFKMTLNESGQQTWNQAPLFFSTIFDALSDSFSISLAKLFDKDTSAKSMWKLIQKCKSESHLFPDAKKVSQELEVLEKELAENRLVDNALCVLQNRRDKLYAHNDKKFFIEPEKVLAEPLHTYQVWELLKWIRHVLMFLISELSVDVSDFEEYSKHSDLKNLLSNR